MIEIYICLLRLTEQGLLTHYWVQPRAISSARLRVGRMVQGAYMKLLMPKYQGKENRVCLTTQFMPRGEVFVFFSPVSHSLLFYINFEEEK